MRIHPLLVVVTGPGEAKVTRVGAMVAMAVLGAVVLLAGWAVTR